jgi:hypothetical protein
MATIKRSFKVLIRLSPRFANEDAKAAPVFADDNIANLSASSSRNECILTAGDDG